MLERYDPTELLELIEGDLDQRAADALRSRLAGDAPAGALVQSMMRDRAALRSFEEPALPQDFLTAIEPMLSRPMLIEPVAELATLKPGEFRRQHRRRGRTLRIGRLAAAAVVLLAAAGGIWAVIEGLGTMRRGQDQNTLASNDNRASLGGSFGNRQRSSRESGALAASDALGPGAVHHDPRPGAGRDLVAASVGTSPSASPEANPASSANVAPTLLAADFVVIVQSASAAAAESSVSGAIADLGERVALVRNFSFAEAQRLSEEYRLAHGGSRNADAARPGDQPMANIAPGTNDTSIHALSGPEMQQLAMQVREQLRLLAPATAETSVAPDSTGSGLISGAPAIAPSLEQQLDFSCRGATHTIAVPASELVALVERLALNDPAAGATVLRMLPAGVASAEANAGAASSSAATLAWLTDGPRVRQALLRLSQAPDDAIVLLPVTLP